MRIIYPSVSSAEYADIARKDNSISPRMNIFLTVTMTSGIYALSFMFFVTFFVVFGHMLSVLRGMVFLLAAVFSGFITVIGFISLKPYMDRKTQESGYNRDMFEYLRLCDSLRVSKGYDVSLHLIGESCRLDLEYTEKGRKQKANLDMSWHINPGISDVVIDFERREVSVPEKMFSELTDVEEK